MQPLCPRTGDDDLTAFVALGACVGRPIIGRTRLRPGRGVDAQQRGCEPDHKATDVMYPSNGVETGSCVAVPEIVRSVLTPDPADHARRFARVRQAHRTEMQEDYGELIGDLIAETGEARAVDLVERLGVAAATVNNTLSRLKRDGLVENRPYRSVFLTPKGKAMAHEARARHEIVVAFLLKLGVAPATAELGAEGL